MQQLKQYLEKSGLSASNFARTIGVAPSALSMFINGKYEGNKEILKQKIENYLANAKLEKNNLNVVFESNDYLMGKFVINESIEEKEIGLIYGAAGSGKSTILREFEKNNPNAILIEATCHTNSKALLEEITEALKINLPKNANARLKEIARYLNTCKKIILIDEAEYLPLRALEDLRRIHDFSRTPLILCGTEILLRNLMGRNKELRQLYSRIGSKWAMCGLSKAECKDFFNEWIYEFSEGLFRSSSKLYKKALKLSKHYKVQIDKELIIKASNMVVLG